MVNLPKFHDESPRYAIGHPIAANLRTGGNLVFRLSESKDDRLARGSRSRGGSLKVSLRPDLGGEGAEQIPAMLGAHYRLLGTVRGEAELLNGANLTNAMWIC